MTDAYQPGATGWDVLLRSSENLKKLMLLLLAALGLYVAFNYLEDEVIEAVILGAVLGWIITARLARPYGRLVLVVPADMKDEMIRLVWIPEEHYARFNTCGNGYALTSMMGIPFYIAKKLDLDKKEIDYSWVHEKSIAQVYAYESVLKEFLNDAQAAMVDNLAISQYPKLWGARLAKHPVEFVSNQFGKLAGLPVDPESVDIVDLANIAGEEKEELQ